MPNWCVTDYTLVGSEEDVNAACEALDKLVKTPRPSVKEAGYDTYLTVPQWLGYIVEDILGKPYRLLDCRGTFYGHGTSTWKDKSSLVFSTETAWAPCPKMMEELAAKFRLSLNFYSQEPGSIYYVRQSPDGVYTDTLHYESEEYGEDFYESLADFLKAHGAQYGLSADATLEETLAAVNATEDDRLDEIEDLSQAS